MKDWDALYEECIHCQKCGLAETRTNVVFGEGARDAEVMFIGEGPGEQEDRTGRPFVGRAGQLLDDMLAMIDLKREKVFIGNMVKCRPPQNRDPLTSSRRPASAICAIRWPCSSRRSSSAWGASPP